MVKCKTCGKDYKVAGHVCYPSREDTRIKKEEDYKIALQQAIEAHCRGELVIGGIVKICPHHAKMLNEHWWNEGR
jgi:hypothetical protein